MALLDSSSDGDEEEVESETSRNNIPGEVIPAVWKPAARLAEQIQQPPRIPCLHPLSVSQILKFTNQLQTAMSLKDPNADGLAKKLAAGEHPISKAPQLCMWVVKQCGLFIDLPL